MSKTFDYLIFFGRFQPLHNGHMYVIEEALRQARKVIVMVGSANRARSPKDPFSAFERELLILGAVRSGRVIVKHIDDFYNNDTAWIGEAQRIVNHTILDDMNGGGIYLSGLKDAKIGLIGFAKDRSSYYLKLFPTWHPAEVQVQYSTLNSTEIREQYLQNFFRLPAIDHVPPNVVKFMSEFTTRSEFKWLVKENASNRSYNPRIYDNDIVACVDAVVVQSGHILLVERKNHPGKGLLALPGGHVNKNERFRTAVIRELREETHISDDKGELPPAMLDSFIKKWEFFDDPNRSLRARVTTMAYFFELPNRTTMFTVKGDDDAESASWYKIGDLDPTNFFEDHFFIIQTMLGTRIT